MRTGACPSRALASRPGRPGRARFACVQGPVIWLIVYFTTVEALAVLSVRSESMLWLVTVTVLVMVMLREATTLTTICNWTLAPALSVVRLHLTVPLAPTAGVVHVTPAGRVIDWNCVNAGSGSLITMPEAALGPAFFSVTV